MEHPPSWYTAKAFAKRDEECADAVVAHMQNVWATTRAPSGSETVTIQASDTTWWGGAVFWGLCRKNEYTWPSALGGSGRSEFGQWHISDKVAPLVQQRLNTVFPGATAQDSYTGPVIRFLHAGVTVQWRTPPPLAEK